MGGIPNNYISPATNGQNSQPYTPSAGPNNLLVDKYFSKIKSNWQERAADANVMGKVPLPPSLTRSLEIRKDLEEGLIQKELKRVRNEFLQEAGKLEAERMIVLEAQCEEKYRSQLEETDKDVNRAYRIINIQNAILTKIFESNKDALLNVIKDLDITEEDLEILASSGKL